MDKKDIFNRIFNMLYDFTDLEIDKNAVSELLQYCAYKQYSKGEIILSVGERCKNVGYVLKGIIRSYYLDKSGNDVTKLFHTENHLFMDEGLVYYEKSICTFEALEDCDILLIPTKTTKDIIMQNEFLKDLYIVSLEGGLRYKITRKNAFLTKTATERYILFKNEYPNLDKRIKQSYIATYLGVAPETLSRIRRTLREENDSIL